MCSSRKRAVSAWAESNVGSYVKRPSCRKLPQGWGWGLTMGGVQQQQAWGQQQERPPRTARLAQALLRAHIPG